MSTQDERRADGGQRIPFEALVVVADEKSDKSGAPYECEAVDLSEHGMHLRTAYLPDLGQSLTFRFDGGLGEVTAEGTVLWRDEQAKGGEFGVRFTKLDDASLRALRDICGVEEASPQTRQSGLTPAPRGARVRLHIEGLGSPMRARVRDSATAEVMVGSNLEFLKVGKTLDLEDAEAGKKRPAIVDRVEVEVDPETKIPQLVVRLRYDDVPADVAAKSKSLGEPAKKASDEPDAAEAKDEDDDLLADKPTALDALSDKAKAFASAMGPKLSAIGAGAKKGIGSLVAKAKSKRDEPEAQGEKKKRVTSPPPDGALRASGRAVTRGGKDEDMEDLPLEENDADRSKEKRRAKIFAASAAGFLAIMIAIFAFKSKGTPPPGDAPADEKPTAQLPPPASPPPGAPAASGEAVSANVPLFGPTPLSTTEAVPPPAPDAKAAPPAGGDDDDAKGKDEPGETTFGKGAVHNPKIVRIKMDAPITGLKGATDKHAITITLPGRRNVEPAGGLAKKDKRLSSIKAVPKDGGVEVVYTFKEGVPPFMAKVDGKLLVLELGEAKSSDGDDEKTAKKGGKKKNKAVAKKKGKKAH